MIKAFYSFFAGIALWTKAGIVSAASVTEGVLNCGTGDAKACGPAKDPTVELLKLADRSLEYVLVIGGFAALCGVVYGAILFLAAGGDTEKIAKGRKALLASFVGVILIVMALVSVKLFSELLGGAVVDTPS